MAEVEVEVGGSRHYELTHQILIYSGPKGLASPGNAYAVFTEPDGSRVRGLDPKRFRPYAPVTMEFVQALAEGLGVSLHPEVLPENIVTRTQARLAWWTPPARRTLFFTDASKLGGLSGLDLPVPALVWRLDVGNDRRLYVRALKGGVRPGAGTPLCLAPFLNVERNGLVCQGTMRRPNAVTLSTLGEWEDGFFGAAFGSALYDGITSNKGDVHGLWPLLRRRKTFPPEHLRSSDETLAQFIGAA